MREKFLDHILDSIIDISMKQKKKTTFVKKPKKKTLLLDEKRQKTTKLGVENQWHWRL